MRISGFLFFLLEFLCCIKPVKAQIIIDEPPKPLYYDRSMRVKKFLEMKDMRDVFHYDKFLLGTNRISGSISYTTGRVQINNGEMIRNEYRSAIGFFSRIRFVEEFSLNTVFYKDFNPNAVAPWISDYTYTFGRYNWRPGKFNYGYENYVNNKYTDNLKVFSEKFLQGYYFVSYSHFLSDKLTRKIKLDSTTNLRFTYFSRYAISYINAANEIEGGLLYGKFLLGASFRYTIYRNIYIESAVYYYPDKTKQQPWDPDYSYGFGYFDWRSFRLTVSYGNWAVNRFPWDKNYYPSYGFLDGQFKIGGNFIW